MNFQSVRVLPIENKTSFPIIQISEALARKLKIQASASVVDVCCSRNRMACQLVCIKEKDFVLMVDKHVLEFLMLSMEERTYLVTYEGGMLHIGPVIGLLTEIATSGEKVILKNIEAYCQELAGYSEDIGVIFYVFTLEEPWSASKVSGYVFDQGGWTKAELPFPQVVHNRLHKRTNERSEMFQRFIKDLQESGTPYFNNHFLNKWTVHEQLVNTDYLVPYLPETELFSFKRFEEAITKFPVLFIKPIFGSQGRQIFKVGREQDGYSLRYSSFQQEVSKTYKSLKELYDRVSVQTKKRQYIIQQGLDLLKMDGRPIDFRYLCHRAENNRWRITSSTARASKCGAFVSNLAQGGELLSVEKALGTKFDSTETPQIVKHLRELALEVSKEIGTLSEGIFGELGIDLAIDTDGRPWIIEVNTKPSKNMDPPTDSGRIRPSAKAVILYCLFLIHDNLKER